MKVYKKNHHSLFVKPFGVQGKLYLALTVFVYFDLTAPDDPLKEQDLWKEVPELLKPNPILDVGVPKPRGEVLVTGSCFSPRGTTRPASTVSVRVGGVRKELAVFGDRFWKRDYSGLALISDPLPFSEIPVTWQNAFGGKEFPDNPVGKGMDPVVKEDGETLHPLPNIEYGHGLIGSPSEKPRPAGLGPLDMMAPMRQKKTGTYDDRWLAERWPYFPDDMDYEYFNSASDDQYLDGFFTGTEVIEIANMNPDMPHISSHMPAHRVRCFVTKKESLRSEAEIFQEVTTHIDTLWLFPSVLRGVVMYRGTTEIWDEEYDDVLRIFIAGEHPADPPGTIEHYLEEQKKAADLTVPMDLSPLEKASKDIGDMMKRLKKIPKEIDNALKMAQGKAPVMPRSPTEMAAGGQKVIADSLAVLDKLEAQSRGFQSQYGHLAKIDLTMFDRMRKKLMETSAVAGETAKKAEAMSADLLKKAETAVKEGAERMRKAFPADLLEKAGFAPEALLDRTKKVNPWHDRGFPFVVERRRTLEGDRDVQGMLHALGIDHRSTAKAWLGINREEVKEEKSLWGLKPSGESEDARSLTLAKGLVLPRFDGAVLNRILILPPGWEKGAPLEDMRLVEGSDTTPLFFLAEEGAPVVRVADELQAILLEQELGDACSVISLQGPDEKPSKEGADEIKEQDFFVVIVPEKCTPDSKEWGSWHTAYPKAIILPLPKGRTLFEAGASGIDVRKFVMDALPKDFAKRHKIAPEMPAPGKPPTAEDLTVPIPHIDVNALVDTSSKEMRAYVEGKTAGLAEKLAAMKQKVLADARAAVAKGGFDPDQVLKMDGSPMPGSIAEKGAKMVADLVSYKAFMKGKNLLTPFLEGKVDEWIADIGKLSAEGQARYDAGMAKLEEAKKTVAEATQKVKAQEMPAEAKAIFKKHGMDPDLMKARTREEVIAMHADGKSLAFARLSGVDLSGLDLTGIDLHEAQCLKTNFKGTILDGGNLCQIMAQEADFTGCSMKGVNVDRVMFTKAKLTKANLSESHMSQTMFKDADLTEADFNGAFLDMAVIMGSTLTKARFHRADARLTVFSDGDASESVYTDGRFERCLFRRLTLDRADCSRAAFPHTAFMEAKGEKTLFTGANMHETRMLNKTSFKEGDFRHAVFTMGSLRETDLSGSDFSGTRLDGSLIEKCVIKDARLSGVSAKASRLTKTDLEGSDMRAINLFGGSLRKSRVVGADMRDSNLFGVDFYKTVFGETRMGGANLKRSLIADWTDILKDEKGIS